MKGFRPYRPLRRLDARAKGRFTKQEASVLPQERFIFLGFLELYSLRKISEKPDLSVLRKNMLQKIFLLLKNGSSGLINHRAEVNYPKLGLRSKTKKHSRTGGANACPLFR